MRKFTESELESPEFTPSPEDYRSIMLGSLLADLVHLTHQELGEVRMRTADLLMRPAPVRVTPKVEMEPLPF